MREVFFGVTETSPELTAGASLHRKEMKILTIGHHVNIPSKIFSSTFSQGAVKDDVSAMELSSFPRSSRIRHERDIGACSCSLGTALPRS